MSTSARRFPILLVAGLVAATIGGGGVALAGSCSGAAQTDIVATAIEAGSFDTLITAVQAAGLSDALRGDGPFTVFAPTDEAFAKLPKGTVEKLLRPENKDRLAAILTYHVVAGELYSADVRPGRVPTLEGSALSVSSRGGELKVDQATVVATDIVTANGVIHVIDEVILPDERRSATRPARELIRMAIERGVPLYNHGQAEACTAVYEIAAQALVDAQNNGLSDHDRSTLQRAMRSTRDTHDARRQAWIMRDALDAVMVSLGRPGSSDEMAMRIR